MEATLLTTRVGPVEVADIGAGPAVILAHGMPGDWSQAAPLARELADRFRVLSVSRPGYGRTPRSTGTTWRDTAAAHTAMLDALEIETAAIIGISGGGPSSHAFASLERARCNALVLACAVHPDVIPLPLALRVVHALPGIREVLGALVNRKEVRGLADPEVLREATMSQATESERERLLEDPIAMEWLLEFAHHHARVTADLSGLRGDLRQLVAHRRGPSTVAWESGPDVPTLVVQGDADKVVTPANAERWQQGIPGAELTILPGAGHAFLFTYRRDSTPLLADFLQSAVPA